MENINTFREYLGHLCELLDDAAVAEIDFDAMKERLAELAEWLGRCRTQQEDFDILAGDYRSRIAGMLKAIAAADRKHRAAQLALQDIDSLPQLSAGELVERYRMTLAMFRDAFPTSFGLLNGRAASSHLTKDISDFK